MTRGAAATPHPLATQAALDVLAEGGTAADAAVTAGAVLAVVAPHMTTPGGDLVALVWAPGARAPEVLLGIGRSGTEATAAEMRGRGHREMPLRGAETITVPGVVEAWGRLVERFGNMGLGRVLAPAAALARDGFIVDGVLSRHLVAAFDWLQEADASRLLPPVKAGMLLRNPELAGVLELVGRSGLQPFYRGEVARRLVAAVRSRGGFLTDFDLARHRSQWVPAVRVGFRDLDVWLPPPPTQGLAAAAMLADLDRGGPWTDGVEPIGRLRAARDRATALRDSLIGDPEFVEVPWEPFLEGASAAAPGRGARDGGDTVHFDVADESGLVVSVTQSVAMSFGSGVIAEGTGVLLHDRGTYFSLEEGHPNELAPGRRPMHTLIPALASRAGRPWAAFGCMGGEGQPQIVAQVLCQLADRGLDPAAAVAAPRVRVAAGGGDLLVEADHPAARELARDPRTRLMPPASEAMGHAQALIVNADGTWEGGADPRAGGTFGSSG